MKLNLMRHIGTGTPKAERALGPGYGLNVTVVYEDAPTRQWAGQVCQRVERLVGKEGARITWWRLADLSEPAVLAGAVSKAIRADVILVATQSFEVFPLPFYVWISSWVPHRFHGPGALVALVATPETCNGRANRDRRFQYLRSVARQGQLDFLVEERPPRKTARRPRRSRSEEMLAAA